MSPDAVRVEIAKRRWLRLKENEQFLDALLWGLVVAFAITALLIWLNVYSPLYWILGVLGSGCLLGLVVRYSSSAVTEKYGIYAFLLTIGSSGFSLLFSVCLKAPSTLSVTACVAALPEFKWLVAACVVSATGAYFFGFRRVSARDLLESEQ